MGILDERQSKQNLENAGDVVISKQDLIDAGLHLITCDVKGCKRQAMVVTSDYVKCDKHEKEQELMELLRKHEEENKKTLDDTE